MKNINNIVDITPNRDDIINIKDIQTLPASVKRHDTADRHNLNEKKLNHFDR
jgi:hypothetical protein